MAASQAARENQRQAQIANIRRQELQPIIDRLREARDYFGAEETLVRDFSRASDQMAAQSAQTGMTNAGSGGLDANRAALLGEMLSGLAQYKSQDEMQRQQLLAAILGDASLYAGQVGTENPTTAGLLGALGGGVAGAGSVLNSFLSTPEGLAALRGAFTPKVGTLQVNDGTGNSGGQFFDFLAGAAARQQPSPTRVGGPVGVGRTGHYLSFQ